jgi:hypothetical protein
VSAQEELTKLRQQVAVQAKRLDYVVLQLAREAKFLPEYKPENKRFHRALNTVVEVRDALDKELTP